MLAEPAAAPVPLRDEGERAILAAYARGSSIDIIAASGHGREQVANLVMHRVAFDRGRAAQLVREFDLACRKEKVMEGIEELLDAATKSGVAKAIRIAVRIREQVRDLDKVMKDTEKERQLLGQKADLQKQLGALDNQLRAFKRASPKRSPAPKATQADPTTGEIRAWARENGLECPGMGRIPKEVQAKYDAAHGRTEP